METTVDIEQGAIVADVMNGTHDPATDVGSMTDELKNNAPHFMENVLKLRSGNRSELESTLSTRTSTKIMNEIAKTMSGATERSLDKRTSFIQYKQLQNVTLEWKNLTYQLWVGKGKNKYLKTILNGVSGAVPSGRLVAVMAPTGGGKTSLINALAGRAAKGGILSGEILVNGAPRDRNFRGISAYVMQDDLLFANLTVRETLEFAAKMRLPREVSDDTKKALMEEIIRELGLTKAENTFIGNEFKRGVSGGERKRTNIAIELLSNPAVIYADEPTSGLDAFQAQNVMECLFTLSAGGRIVMATIHQPRSSIYKMVDLLLLLSEGLQLYFGPARKAVEWFSSLGYPCPVQFNPADFFLDLVSVDYRSEEAENVSRRRIELLTGVFATDGVKKFAPSVEGSNQNLESNNNNSSNGSGTNGAAAAVGGSPTATAGEKKGKNQIGVAPSRFPNTPWTEFGLLLGRSWKQASRERPTQIITIVQSIVIGLVLAGLYSDIPKDTTGIQDETGLLFFVTIFAAFGAMFASLTTFPAERGVVNRERSAKAYHVLPYYLARFICDIPLRVVQALLFGCIVYWIVGLNPSASAFFIFVALLFVEALASQGLGVAVSAVAPNEKMAFALAPALTVILILFGGFYVNADTIPVWLSWVKYLSHLFYAFMGLSINNFKGRGGWSCTSTGEMQQEAAVEEATGCEITGDEILDRLGMSDYDLWMAFVGLLGLLVFYNTLGYLFLRLTKPRYLPLAVEPAESGSVEKKKA